MFGSSTAVKQIEMQEIKTLFQDCPNGCKQCSNPICESKLALIIYNLALEPFKTPWLYDFQGMDVFSSEILKVELSIFRQEDRVRF